MIALFYSDNPDKSLRFGDVVQGYVSAKPIIRKPLISGDCDKFQVEVEKPPFCAILSPSCSIRNKSISLTPLLPVRKTFFDNPNLVQDLTAINREMEPEESIPPEAWKNLSEEKKQTRLAEGRGYAFFSLFVYQRHDLLPEYEIHRKNGNIITNYYMIDFSNTYRLDCDEIVDSSNSPTYSRCLQLSNQARFELLYKIVGYYNRVSKEDAPGLED